MTKDKTKGWLIVRKFKEERKVFKIRILFKKKKKIPIL